MERKHGQVITNQKRCIRSQHMNNQLEGRKEEVKSGRLPSKEMLDKYVSNFLIGKECSFTIDDFYARYNIKKSIT